ncbi:hypothetical protein G7Y89_g12417 [Cudoniella acicularis]|uniref:Glycosyltransferase family 92 protein n=1 Tax=Cudoniella acicularis TaxID=354080 RepID=A0A8H4RBV7_9HELO|nr:hypothetical protein G7Y89_g12417 [Cudoniella acicularis]
MRSAMAINYVQSLNWRLILIGTICFMGLYLMIVDDQSSQILPESQAPIPKKGSPQPQGESGPPAKISMTPSEFDHRFEDGFRVEEPNPVLGKDYDSPLDAIPGRIRPGLKMSSTSLLVPTPTPKPAAKPDPKPAEKEKDPEPAANPDEKEKDPKPTAAAKPDPKPAEKEKDPEPAANPDEKEKDPKPTVAAKPVANPSEKEEAQTGPNIVAKPKEKQPPSTSGAPKASASKKPTPDRRLRPCQQRHERIRNFYIMDDGSSPPLESLSSTFGVPIDTLHFEYQDQAHRGAGHSQQLDIYSRCIEHYGEQHTWMAFLDGDEFLETPAGNETLEEILRDLEDHDDNIGALAVNWQMHTSSGLLTRPESTRKAFVDCIWDDPENGGKNSNNTHVKSIVRTDKALRPSNPHLWYLKDGAITVGEHYDVVNSEAFRIPITRDRIALHHYAGKSREEYEAKMLRGNAMDDPKGEGFWNSLENLLPHVKCPEMAKYNP